MGSSEKTGSQSSGSLLIREAEQGDLESLSTILARSFHPVNPFIKKCIPDTPLVREWFHATFVSDLGDARAHVITAVDPNVAPSVRVVGIVKMRIMHSEDRGAGFWSRELSADHDIATFQPAIDSQVEYRERLFLNKGQTHYFLELLGVDHTYKDRGLGRSLLRKACELADADGLPMFVQANMQAVAFYLKFGFLEEGRVEIPGHIQMTEHLLVRPSAKQGDQR